MKEGKRVESDAEIFEKGRFFNVFNLPKLEAEVLKERVEKNKGIIRIFVHPFFEEVRSWHTPDQKRDIEAIGHAIEKILDLGSEKTPPLFIAQDQLEDLEAKLKDKGITSVYVIPTFIASPEPRLPKEMNLASSGIRDSIRESPNWQILENQLESLGVKKILIGGMWLDIKVTPGWGNSTKRIDLSNCVGTMATVLSKHFEVEISNFAYPQSRKEYQTAKKEIEQGQL